MKLDNYNNLLELFLSQYNKKKFDKIFLQSLKNKENNFSWKKTYDNIQKFSIEIGKNIKACLE